MAKAQDDKNTKILRALLQEPDNKKCMDCGVKGPVYVCSNFNTFICTACSGLHREFNHRVKSISMATFKPEEIKALQTGGNAIARKKWLAKWSPEDFPEPDPSDANRVKAFMKLKYIDKRWYSESGEGPQHQHQHQHQQQQQFSQRPARSGSSGASSGARPDFYPQPEPLTSILGKDIPPIQVNGTGAHPKQPSGVPPPVSAHGHGHGHGQQQSQSSLVDWNASAPKPASSGNDLDELLSVPNTAQQQQYQQQFQAQQQQLHAQQQHHLYQQQQQLVMAQFTNQPQGWGAPPVPNAGYFNPYGSQANIYAQQAPPQQFFGGGPPAPPANFFNPSTAAQSGFPPGPAGGFPQAGNPFPPAAGGAISPTFGQPGGGFPPAQPQTPFSTPAPQANTPFGHAAPQQGFGQSPATLQPSFGQSPAHAQPDFGQPPAAQAPAQPPAAAPAPDKFDIFASLSPLNAPKPASSPSVTSHGPPLNAARGPPLNLNAQPSSSSLAAPHPPATSSSAHNPFGDPFGAAPTPAPAQSHAPPSSAADPFGFGGPSTSHAAPTQSFSQPAQSASFSQPPSFSSQPSFSQPAAHANGDPFGFGGPSPTPAAPTSSANPFGGGGFGGQPQQPQHAPPPAQPSAFSPFNANPFGGQQQPPQQQAQPAQADPWGANPFF